MKLVALVTATASLGAFAEAPRLDASSGTFSCDYKVESRCTSGTATVVLLDGKPQRISFDNFYCARQATLATAAQSRLIAKGLTSGANQVHPVDLTSSHRGIQKCPMLYLSRWLRTG
jgi:hypothetical protein